MKPKSTLCDCAPASLNYVFAARAADHASKRPELISSNMARGDDPRALAVEFAAIHRLRPEVKKPVWHCSLSLPEGERLTSATWAAIVHRFLDKMGFDVALTPFVAVRHNDKPKSDHTHIVVSRISLDSKLWHGAWQAFEMIKACQELEREFGLRLTPGLYGDDDAEAKLKRPDRVADTQSVINANRSKSQRKIDTAEMARLLRECAKVSKDLPTFTAAAAAVGVKVLPNRASTGYVSGLSVVPPGRRKPVPLGDSTGKRLTWPKLLKIFLQNDAAADAAQRAARDAVAAAGRRATERLEARLLQNDHCGDRDQSIAGAPIFRLTALLPDAAKQESIAMGQQQKDAVLVAEEGDVVRARRYDRDRDRQKVAAEADLRAELESATNTQLQRVRQALRNELRSHADDAIERLLARITRLVIRVLSLNQLVLPPTDAERRVFVARETIQRIDTQLLLRRTDAAAEGQPKVRPSHPAALLQPAAPKLQIAIAHDARQALPTTSRRDQDEIARELDAQRERNRT